MGIILLLLLLIAVIVYVCIKLKNPIWKAQFLLMFENWGIYLLSFFVPLVGIIVGSINLTKDEPYKKSVGINCIILGIISIIFGYMILTK